MRLHAAPAACPALVWLARWGLILVLAAGLAGCGGLRHLWTMQRSLLTLATTPVARHLAYGSDPLQTLDIHRPPESFPHPRPVLVFFHGGGWRYGDKGHQAVLLQPYVRRGLVVVSVNYRLAPDHVFPAQLEDAVLALTWLREHLPRYGGEPDQLYLMGHSAGGHLAALLAVQPELLASRGVPPECLRACLALSGVYDLSDVYSPPRVQGYVDHFAPSPEVKRQASPRLLLDHRRLPLLPRFLVAVGSRDYPRFLPQAYDFATALQSGGSQATYLVLPGRDHSQVPSDLGDESTPLFQAIWAIISQPEPRTEN